MVNVRKLSGKNYILTEHEKGKPHIDNKKQKKDPWKR